MKIPIFNDYHWQSDQIWDICEELIKRQDPGILLGDGRRSFMKFTERELIYWYGISDLKKELFSALCITGEEKLACADMVLLEGFGIPF